MPEVREEAFWWIRTARRDLERVYRSIGEGDRGAAVFWAQQAAEKALKSRAHSCEGVRASYSQYT